MKTSRRARRWRGISGRSAIQEATLLASLELEPPERTEEEEEADPQGWRGWLGRYFPDHVTDFSSFQEEFWDWHSQVHSETAPRPFIGVWSRGAGKSTSGELGTAKWGVTGARRYVLYVRDTQDRADDSVTNIAMLLESRRIANRYPQHSEPMLGRFGQSRGWRRNRVRTSGGFTVDALGLDVAARGVKLEQYRPDAIVFDDIDGRHDSKEATKKKIDTITDSLLPAGTSNVAVVGIQNLIIPNGMFSRLVDGRADFLSGRIVSGPHPALLNMKVEKDYWPNGTVRHVLVEEEGYNIPTWDGMDLAACQRLLDIMGLAAFLRECQHNVREREGALWTRDLLNSTRVAKVPDGVVIVRCVVGVDPSGGGDEIGIIVVGKGNNGHSYVLGDYSVPGSAGPLAWATATVDAYHDHQADKVLGEANFGGDMVVSNIHAVDPTLPVEKVNASRGKAVRAEPVASLYEDERAHHVGTYEALETEKTSWVPGDPDSPNRMDAEVWAQHELMLKPEFELLIGNA